MMSAQVNARPAAAADTSKIAPSVGPLDANQGNVSPPLHPTVPETTTSQKRGGSLTPGGSISKSELSSMTGSIASKLDQYLESTNNSLHRHDRGSADSNISLGSLSGVNLDHHNQTNDNHKDNSSAGGEKHNSGSVYAGGSAGSINGELDDDTTLANNLAAISLATQKISEIYLEPKPKKSAPDGHQVTNDHFESEKHFYPRVLNAQIHPMVGYFFSLGNERIIARYMHLNPQVNEDVLRKCLDYVPKHFQWA
ncbi:hypothetical protein BG015_005369, partial [Linnemannia schmuckeri]